MENRTVLVDTSILIDFLRKERKDKTIFWQLREQSPCAISSVTLFELLIGAKTEQRQQDIRILCKTIEILSFDIACAEVAARIFGELKAQNELIEFRDIFIGATARLHQLELATLNTKHFERIDKVHLRHLSL